nr:FeoB-associated Cys-rich membrane protein [Bacillus kwashiorkori]
MVFDILLGGGIFGYAIWQLSKYIKKSRKGKCAACELNKNCQTKCH